MIIKKIDILSAGKITAVIAAAIGLIAGLIMLLFGSFFAALGGEANGGGFMALGGALSVVILPIMYGIFGFIGGVLQAFVYNIAAGFMGGIRIETE